MNTLTFLSAYLLLIPAGIFGACLPIVRELGRPTRAASAMLCGAIALTAEALLFSLAGIPWSLPSLLIPLITASALAGWLLCRLPESPGPENAYPGFPAALIVLAATAHLVAMLATSRATSIDFTYFWGVKAVHFAERGGIDDALLRWQYFIHAVPDYPQLVPVTQALGVLALGKMAWVGAPLSSALWLLAGLPIVASMLAMHMPLRKAWMIAAFWYAAMAMSLASSYSGGNAEAPLLVFETLGALAVYGCAKEPRLAPFAALMLCGAAMTKVEALVTIAAIVAGAFLRDLERGLRPAARNAAILLSGPAFALALWFGYQLASGMEVGYRPHGELTRLHWDHLAAILRAFPSNLAAGTFGLSWVIPLTIIVVMLPANRRRIASLLPLLAPVVALALFFVFDYLHDAGEVTERIGWTLPRISQPALSMLILAAGLVYRDAARPAHQHGSQLHAR
ncbi:MAG: hypothetical protein ACSLFQ_15800 [Thermoanaerobaculia bacterium]